jgi:hypothetical protein
MKRSNLKLLTLVLSIVMVLTLVLPVASTFASGPGGGNNNNGGYNFPGNNNNDNHNGNNDGRGGKGDKGGKGDRGNDHGGKCRWNCPPPPPPPPPPPVVVPPVPGNKTSWGRLMEAQLSFISDVDTVVQILSSGPLGNVKLLANEAAVGFCSGMSAGGCKLELWDGKTDKLFATVSPPVSGAHADASFVFKNGTWSVMDNGAGVALVQ